MENILKGVTGLAKHFTVETLRAHLLSRAVRSTDGCLEFRGYGRNRAIYQKMSVNAWAHIAAFAAFVGPVDSTLDVHHLCSNPPCIEPSHLQQITHADNTLRREQRASCAHLREFDDAGRLKRCRPCNAANQQRWRDRRGILDGIFR